MQFRKKVMSEICGGGWWGSWTVWGNESFPTLSYDDEKTFLTVLPWFHTANEKGMHENHLYLSSYYGIK